MRNYPLSFKTGKYFPYTWPGITETTHGCVVAFNGKNTQEMLAAARDVTSLFYTLSRILLNLTATSSPQPLLLSLPNKENVGPLKPRKRKKNESLKFKF